MFLGLQVLKSTILNKILNKTLRRNSYIVYLIDKTLRLFLLPIAKIKFRKKNLWLVCERGTDARDNGYHMFRYLRKEHPEISAWYVITKDSPDLDKISDLGNIVYRGSLNHWLVFIFATKVLTSIGVMNYVPSGNHEFGRYVIKKNRQKIIFLQHGVIANDIPLYHQEQAKFDLFICGAKPEYNFVSECFNYTRNEVRYTGLARFDALHNVSSKRQILIMSTWRKWLFEEEEQVVAESEYVERWNRLLQHPRLEELTKRYNIDIIFYPHQLMQKFLRAFSSSNKHVIIGDYHNYDVQKLLQESSLLITDISSVHFDFAYMHKPVLYYQFDEEEFFKNHNFERGYFDYEKMGFGEKVKNENELIDLMEEYISNDFQLKPEFKMRIAGFFPLHDNNNCKRIFHEIVSTFDEE